MLIHYKVLKDASFDLDIDKLVDIIVDGEEDLDESITWYWGDNVEHFLEEVGFEHYDNLSNETKDKIYDIVYEKLIERCHEKV